MKEVIVLEPLRAVVGAELIESSRVPGTKHFSYIFHTYLLSLILDCHLVDKIKSQVKVEQEEL